MSKIKVNVNEDELLHGDQMILTLDDRLLLNGDQINEDDDVLVNVHLKEQEKI